MKKGFIVMLAFALFLTLGFGQHADAKPRGGGIKSPKQSVTQNPKKSENVNQTNPGTKAGTTAGATKPGFFGGGSLMKGLMIGGLAGLMFGSLFAGMGAFGNILGLMINLLAIFAIIMLIRVAFVYLKSKRTPPDRRRPY
ncbi:putative lipid-binding transport protein (Tim44 family) [Paenibacillus endophyticus]|uniref:Putative lipid-binding transport protein (Tim44 family) n=1 Tax=Paenibacillus endophyticus TaxID=1294268 RepID=A0A7W5C5U8_9BACL|nr:hypothetical protein [Paenibacillus endophyticus]MBB3151728.1 putative lipid-binding transport protein (Tim44 family) [Paenibacillus endophyticus]